MQRRDWLKSAAASAAGLTILKSGALGGQNAPNDRLNVALIGVWGRGTAHYNVLRNENVVALCDTNDLRTKEALKIFPKAKRNPINDRREYTGTGAGAWTRRTWKP